MMNKENKKLTESINKLANIFKNSRTPILRIISKQLFQQVIEEYLQEKINKMFVNLD